MDRVSRRAAEAGVRKSKAVAGRRFNAERVVLSGASFTGCHFRDCELVYDGRPTLLEDNVFESCRWSFEGPAANTLSLLRSLCATDAGFAHQFALNMGLPTGWPQ